MIEFLRLSPILSVTSLFAVLSGSNFLDEQEFSEGGKIQVWPDMDSKGLAYAENIDR
jgi:hypothetical protein